MALQDLCVKVIYKNNLNLCLLPPVMKKSVDINELNEFGELKRFIKEVYDLDYDSFNLLLPDDDFFYKLVTRCIELLVLTNGILENTTFNYVSTFMSKICKNVEEAKQNFRWTDVEIERILLQLYDNTLINIVQTLIKHGHFGALRMLLDDVVDKHKNYHICDYYMDLIVDELVKVKKFFILANILLCSAAWEVLDGILVRRFASVI